MEKFYPALEEREIFALGVRVPPKLVNFYGGELSFGLGTAIVSAALPYLKWPIDSANKLDLEMFAFGSGDLSILLGLTATIFGCVVIHAGKEKIAEDKVNEYKIKELERQLSNYNKDYFERVRTWLKELMKNELNVDGVNERGTIYRLHNGAAFFQLGRWSDNQDFEAPGRRSYRRTEGVLGSAWTQGEAFADNFPDYNKDKKGYRLKQREWGLMNPEIDSLTMKSRCYAAYSLRDENDEKTVVLVLESLKAGTFKQSVISEVMTRELPKLSHKIQSARNSEPTYESAKKRGF